MPELPEVQTIVSDLNQKIVGLTITDFWSEWGKAIKNRSIADFSKEIKGRKILSVRRIGKNIFVDLTGGKTIYLHMKMTGHLLVRSTVNSQQSSGLDYFSDRVNQYIRHKWFLKSEIKNSKLNQNSKFKIQNFDTILEFSDLRKFGKIMLLDTGKETDNKDIRALGVDAMSDKFTFDVLKSILECKKNKKIRDILLDQTLIAGIGNIYVSEILFGVGIHPARLAKKITPLEQKKLHCEIIKVLKKAIKLRGTSDSDYRDTSGAPGGFQNVLRVYRCQGEKCQRCGTILKREKMGQRSAFFCPQCQK